MSRFSASTWKWSRAARIAALFVVIGSLATMSGQTFLSTIGGLVTDSTGGVIPGARVTLTETQTGVQRVAETNSAGNYVFAELPTGSYKVTVMKTGFKEVVSSELQLTTQAPVRFDAALTVGSVNEAVEVKANAPTLNTENAQLGTVTTRDEILNLPVLSRGAMDYRYLSSSNQDGGYIAGQRSSFGFYSIDGISTMSPAWGAWSGPMMSGMSMEAVQDITQVTATPSAEFGDVATISLSTRSGTNTLHGAGFFETRNYALDAAGYFSHSKPKGPYRQYFGGSIGGPVYIPHVYDGRNKTFFFFTWEEFLQPGGHTTLASVPTQAFRNGDFSSLLSQGVSIYDPTTGQAFAGNVIPTSRISAVSNKIQATQYMPLPNFGASGSISNNFLDAFPNAHAHYYPTARVDHNFRDGKDVLTGRYTYRHQNEDSNTNGLPFFNQTQYRNTSNEYLSETHLFSPTVINEFRIGFSRDFSLYHGLAKGADIVNAFGLQLPNVDSMKDLYGFPQVNFQNFTGLGSNANAGWTNDVMSYLDNITLTRGKHTIKVGGSISRYKVNETTGNAAHQFGYTTFDSFGTRDSANQNGFDYASFLLGVPEYSGTSGLANHAIVTYGTTALYLQEDWRATSNLTVNFGLRWEKTTTPVDQHDMRYAFDPSTGNLVVPTQQSLSLVSPVFPTSIPIVTAAQAGFPSRSLVSADNNWGPRAGFAYRLPYKMVVRAGAGLFYTPLLTWAVIDAYDGGPFQLTQDFHNRMTNGVPAFQFPNPYTMIGSGDFAGVSIGGLQKKVRTPYSEQWNITLEKEFGNSTVARASYRGHHTTELLYYADLNQPHVSNNPDNEWNTIYSNFWTVDNGRNGGSEIGHLLELQFQRKYANGLTLDTGYTHSKVVNDIRGSDIMGWPGYSWNINRDSGNENGLSRHRFTMDAIWDLPFGTHKRYGANLPKWVQQTAGNWQTSYILVMQSGKFLDPGCGNCPDTSYARVYDRPDQVGTPKLSNPTPTVWFNAKAFAQPAYGTLGNSATGVIVGPGLVNFDFGLFKYFQLTEKARFQVKMTATNFFNHPNLGNPNTDITSVNAGLITGLSGAGMNGSSNNMRSIMLGARVEF